MIVRSEENSLVFFPQFQSKYNCLWLNLPFYTLHKIKQGV